MRLVVNFLLQDARARAAAWLAGRRALDGRVAPDEGPAGGRAVAGAGAGAGRPGAADRACCGDAPTAHGRGSAHGCRAACHRAVVPAGHAGERSVRRAPAVGGIAARGWTPCGCTRPAGSVSWCRRAPCSARGRFHNCLRMGVGGDWTEHSMWPRCGGWVPSPAACPRGGVQYSRLIMTLDAPTDSQEFVFLSWFSPNSYLHC